MGASTAQGVKKRFIPPAHGVSSWRSRYARTQSQVFGEVRRYAAVLVAKLTMSTIL
jgi:hypothetical protein